MEPLEQIVLCSTPSQLQTTAQSDLLIDSSCPVKPNEANLDSIRRDATILLRHSESGPSPSLQALGDCKIYAYVCKVRILDIPIGSQDIWSQQPCGTSSFIGLRP